MSKYNKDMTFDNLIRKIDSLTNNAMSSFYLKNIDDLKLKIIRFRDEIHREGIDENSEIYAEKLNTFVDSYNNIKNMIKNRQKRPMEVNFFNQEDVLDKLTSRRSPLKVLLYAPSGYGKTWVVKRIADNFKEKNWIFAIISIDKKDSTISKIGSSILKSINIDDDSLETHCDDKPAIFGQKLGVIINDRYSIKKKTNGLEFIKLLIIIDGIGINNKLLLSKFMTMIKELGQILDPDKSLENIRLIVTTNEPIFLNRKNENHKLKIIELKPFAYETVKETVFDCYRRSTYINKMTDREMRRLSAYIRFRSGGHPGCMSNMIIDYDYNEYSLEIMEESFSLYYEKHLKPSIGGIKIWIESNFKGNYWSILEKLSPIRKISKNILSFLKEEKIIDFEDITTLDKELTKSIYRREAAFSYDDILRRLILIYFENEGNNYDLIQNICLRTSIICENLAKTMKHRPDIYLVEYLYQKLQCIYYDSEKKSKAENEKIFFDCVDQITEELKLENNDNFNETLESALDLISEDHEFIFMLNYILRIEKNDNYKIPSVYNDEMSDRLIHSIEKQIN